MFFLDGWRRWLNQNQKESSSDWKSRKSRRQRYRLTVEALENRTVPALILNVNTNLDIVDADPNTLSLREAILEANASTELDVTINLPGNLGVYELTRAGNDDVGLFGDLDLNKPNGGIVRIVGAGAATTIISAGPWDDSGFFDRVLQIHSGDQPLSVIISGVTIQNGQAPLVEGDNAFGGGIYTEVDLTLTNSVIQNNTAFGAEGGSAFGGGIYNDGGVLILNSTQVSGNVAEGGDDFFGSAGFAFGGGIYSDRAQVTIQQGSVITNNQALGGHAIGDDNTVQGGDALGGGLFVGFEGIAGLVTISDSIVSNNTARGGGGVSIGREGGVFPLGFGGDALGGGIFAGLFLVGHELNITNSTISGNSALGGEGFGGFDELFNGGVGGSAYGGGLFTGFEGLGGDINILNSTIADNEAIGGEGVLGSGGGFTIGVGGEGHGGGIFNGFEFVSGTMVIYGSTISGNVVAGGDGVNFADDDDVFALGGEGYGGGLFTGFNVFSRPVIITNSTFSGNQAFGGQATAPEGEAFAGSGFGGAIYSGTGCGCDERVPHFLTNVTITQNVAAGGIATGAAGIDGEGLGGGIFAGFESFDDSSMTLQNTILGENAADLGPDFLGSVNSLGNNLVSDDTDSDGWLGSDLLNVPSGLDPVLADNGGPTLTHALLPGSLAINAGNNDAIENPPFPGPPFFDQRGPNFLRIQFGTVDIGAFEVQEPSISTIIATGADAGTTPHVKVFDAEGNVIASFFAYHPSFLGGVRVAVGDVNGDGVPDIITGAGPGGGPHVKVIDGTKLDEVLPNGMIAPSAVLASFFAYSPTFTGGVYVGVGELNGNPGVEVITGAGAGGGPHVRSFQIAGGVATQLPGPLGSFFAYAPTFTGGVRVAAGDVTGNGLDEILTGAGPGGGPHVKAFNAAGTTIRSFFAYNPTFTGGVYVASGDINGDGFDDIITGAGAGGGPHVKVFNGLNLITLASYFAYDASFLGGVRVGVTPIGNQLHLPDCGCGGGEFEITSQEYILTAPGPVPTQNGIPKFNQGSSTTIQGTFVGPLVRVWELQVGAIALIDEFFAYDPMFGGGLFVAGVNPPNLID
ncbi:MAG: choice-of-anchor Q domain-containing protein [Gemmataceae bacterium]